MPGINRSSLILAFILFFGASAVQALTVDNLYVAEVLVTNESKQQLHRGAQAGLMQVLLRVSGTQDVNQSSLIDRALRTPERYYYQFSYHSTDKTLLVGEETVPATLLHINFEPSSIARLLRSAQLPVWGSNRPSVLIWLAENTTGERRLLSENDTDEIKQVLKDQARLRGLPLLFPLLDLEDSAAISTAEVWGAFLGRIDDASRRYNPDATLSARVHKDQLGRWVANWSYRIDRDWQVVDSASFNLSELIRGMVDRLANDLAERYALDSSRSQTVMIVEDVKTLGDYAALSKYLESLAPVLSSSVVRIEGNEAEFKLSTEGQREQLIEIIELDEHMVLLNSQSTNNILRYRWLP